MSVIDRILNNAVFAYAAELYVRREATSRSRRQGHSARLLWPYVRGNRACRLCAQNGAFKDLGVRRPGSNSVSALDQTLEGQGLDLPRQQRQPTGQK